ncbi:MAG: MFS transporter [Anaerolineales bacterium]|nr:MFS transporter [Anaerolineales bacterium]
MPRPTAKPPNLWLTFVLICTPILIGSIDLTAIVVVLPQATLDILGPRGLERADAALWTVTAYLLAYTISLAVMGRLSDVLPRRRVFLACIVIFIIGALWAGTATGFPLQVISTLPFFPDRDMLPLISLIIGRVIQAIGAGASVSVGMALVGDLFPPERRARPISLIGAVDSMGWVIGNLYAGLLLQILPSWRWLFLINAGIALIALILTVIALRGYPEQPLPSTTSSIPLRGVRHFDWGGAFFFAAALITLTLGAESIGKAASLPFLLSSAILFVIFFLLQARLKSALIDLRFIFGRRVRAALVVNLIIGLSLILFVAGVPLMINLRVVFLKGEGLLSGALQAGLMLSALTIPLVAGVIVGERRYHRVGAAIPIALGLLLTIIGFCLTTFWTYTAPTILIAIPLAIAGAGLGLTMGPLSLIVIDKAKESERGLASSIVLVMRLLGMTIGTPLAATLTLSHAGTWAWERAAILNPIFQPVARSMLVPPMAVEALMQVLLIGALVCTVGLVLFYLLQALWNILVHGVGVLLTGMLPVVGMVALVVVIAAVSTLAAPAVVPNPVARQLPADVELYIGVNIQQVFLLNSKRPLDAVVNTLEGIIASANPAPASAAPPEKSSPDGETPTGVEGGQDTPPLPDQPPDTPTDIIVKFLFQPRRWQQGDYAPFCPPGIPEGDYQWCFNNSLLSWIGPQAAFALFPTPSETGGADTIGAANRDYLFAFQATNRNNAVKFIAALAEALRESPPVELRPNVHLLAINVGRAQARSVAVTDAYVLIGTPGAIQRTLERTQPTLAEQSQYKEVIGELPTDGFATLFYRAESILASMRPVLFTALPSERVAALIRLLTQLSPPIFAVNASDPIRVGVALRVNETRLMLTTSAHFPFDLTWIQKSAVPLGRLNLVSDDARAWIAFHLNLAQMVKDADIGAFLEMIARESGDATLQGALSNPLIRTPILNFVRTMQGVFVHAEGTTILSVQPDGATLIAPLLDTAEESAAVAVRRLLPMLQLTAQVASVAGIPVTISETPLPEGGTVVTLSGALLPVTLHYTLTVDNLLVVRLGGTPAAVRIIPGTLGVGRVKQAFGEALTRGLYGFITPPSSAAPAPLLFGGSIRGRTVRIDAVLVTD